VERRSRMRQAICSGNAVACVPSIKCVYGWQPALPLARQPMPICNRPKLQPVARLVSVTNSTIACALFKDFPSWGDILMRRHGIGPQHIEEFFLAAVGLALRCWMQSYRYT